MFFVPIPRKIAKERGLKYYLTDTLCPNGNIANRQVSNYGCRCLDCKATLKKYADKYNAKYRVANKEAIQKYRDEHKEEKSIYNKKYKQANRERCRLDVIKYQKKNPEKVKEWLRKSAEKHREKRLAYSRKMYKENPEKIYERNRKSNLKHIDRLRATRKLYRQNNSAKINMYGASRRSKRHTFELCNELTNFVVQECYSLNILRKNIFTFDWHVDHMIPIQSKNVCGLHVWNNFQCIPQTMNSRKSNKLIYTNPHEWLYDIPKFFKVVYQKEITA